MPQFVCIAVPQFIGQTIDGRTEVTDLKTSGFVERLHAKWETIHPYYDAYDSPVTAVNAALAETIATNSSRFPIVLAADCVSALGMVKGLSHTQDDVGVVWYDAHGDFNTPETTPSGFLGGMPLAALVGRGNQHLLEGIGLQPIPEARVTITDVRDLDPEEGGNLEASQITVYTNVNDLLNAPLPDHPVYVHLDVDIVDPQYMPALGYPAPNGPTPEQVAATLKRLAQSGKTVGLLVSLWNGDKATDDTPLQNTLKMIEAFLEGLE